MEAIFYHRRIAVAWIAEVPSVGQEVISTIRDGGIVVEEGLSFRQTDIGKIEGGSWQCKHIKGYGFSHAHTTTVGSNDQ